jgi:hypothetical protein
VCSSRDTWSLRPLSTFVLRLLPFLLACLPARLQVRQNKSEIDLPILKEAMDKVRQPAALACWGLLLWLAGACCWGLLLWLAGLWWGLPACLTLCLPASSPPTTATPPSQLSVARAAAVGLRFSCACIHSVFRLQVRLGLPHQSLPDSAAKRQYAAIEAAR